MHIISETLLKVATNISHFLIHLFQVHLSISSILLFFFRTWYEIYLCFLYFTVLIDKAFDAGFELTEDPLSRWHKILTIVLDILCWIDIGMNFFTGYIVSHKRQVELRLLKIAR